MKRYCCIALFVATVSWLPAADPVKPAEQKYTGMFNGKDLDGWVNVNCAPKTFVAKDNEIVTNGRPTGFLRSEKQYENFVLEMDWMHINKTEVGNSGLFVWGDPLPAVGTGYTRGIEVQVLVNLNVKDTYTSHGDLFSIWGAKCKPDRPHPKGWERCLPSENLCKGGGEWNHYKVTGNNGVLKLEVNGKEVSGVSECRPRKGYLALESEGAECHFKNINIRELPSTNPKPEEIADLDRGHKSLFDGLSFEGWQVEKDSWKAGDGTLRAIKETTLTTKATYAAFDLIFDMKLPKGAKGLKIKAENGELELAADAGAWKRVVYKTDPAKKTRTVTIGGKTVDVKIPFTDKEGTIGFVGTPGLEIRSVFLAK